MATIYSAICNQDAALANRAAEYVAEFHPGISVTVEPERATLRSASGDADRLRVIWQTALLNEKLLVRHEDGRQRVLQSLIG